MLSISAMSYYVMSAKTLTRNFNWYSIPLIFFIKPILMRIKNQQNFYVSNLMDIWTLKEVLVDKQYEKYKKVKKGDCVVDIGAAIGEFSLYAAQKAKKVVAYECDSERISLMKRNVALNNISNVYLREESATSLKQVLDGTTVCSFLKIDCEGGEYKIFKNADRSDLNKIRYIAMEAHKFNNKMEKRYSNLIKTLKTNKFKVRIVPNPVHNNICFVFASKGS